MMKNNSQNTENQHTEDLFSQLSDTQWRFVTAMVENPSYTKKDAANHIGITPDTVYRWDKVVDRAIEQARLNIHNAALGMRKQAVLKAIAVKIALLDSDDENVRSRAATELIEWELGKATQQHDIGNADGKPFETKHTEHVVHGVEDATEIIKELQRLGVFNGSDINATDDTETN